MHAKSLPLTLTVVALVTALLPAPTHASEHEDVLATVYEAAEMSPLNMDFDQENNRFIAHPGWLEDKLVHYYKFMMYTPGTYPDNVDPVEIPVAPVYLVTTTGDFDGVVPEQLPILQFHHQDMPLYSDFVQVHFVTVDADYVANTYTTYEDIADLGSVEATDHYANLPVVPTGSTLQHPLAPAQDAPIEPLMAWYGGQEVQAFVFEVTTDEAAAFFQEGTRTSEAAGPGSGFEVPVVPDFIRSDGSVHFIPIWHVNQYFTGVTPGENNGGPAAMGQRNVINFDRQDPGYSPLWQVFWLTQLPPDYEADQVSNNEQFSAENGFSIARTPMFVNCPNIGPHGGTTENPDKAASFDASPTLDAGETARLEGSLVMQPGAEVTLVRGSTKLATATTGMMGAYAFEVSHEDLEEGDNALEVQGPDGSVVASWTLTKPAAMADGSDGDADGGVDDGDGMQDDDGAADEPEPAPAVGLLVALAVLALAAAVLRRR